MDKCYTVEWNSHEGEPELLYVYKEFQHALDQCVLAIEESKRTEEDFNPDYLYHVVVETVEGATWVELHSVSRSGDIDDERSRLIEWYKIKSMLFADEDA